MTICTVEIDVAADRERTFAYLADAANQPQWRHDVATRITMDLEMTPSGPWILMRPFVPLMVKAERKKYAAGLQAALT